MSLPPPGPFRPQPRANVAAAEALAPTSHPETTITGGAHLPGQPVAQDAPAQLPVLPTYPAVGIDCSPEAQARRWQQLQDLEARLASGVQSVSDRNRQVSFVSGDNLARAISALRAQLNYCQTGAWPARMRLVYPPQVKAL